MKNKKALLILTIIIGIIICVLIIDSEKFKEQTSLLLAPKEIGKGIAMPYVFAEDLERTNSTWYYNWGACPTIYGDCVPMSYAGEDPQLPKNYNGYILLFNEPNNFPPYGQTITPQEGAAIYLNLRALYPNAKWVVGNVSAWSLQWLIDFRAACGSSYIAPEAWGMHGYVEAWITTKHLINWWTEAHNVIGGNFWITEWADTHGNIKNDELLANWFETQDWIKRWAYFCNRAKGTEPWYPSDWVVQLFEWDTGIPTEIGNWYINGINYIYIPLMIHR